MVQEEVPKNFTKRQEWLKKEKELWVDYKKEGINTDAENALLEFYIPLIKTIVNSMLGGNVEFNDCYSSGLIALLKIVRTKEPINNKFSSGGFSSYLGQKARMLIIDDLRKLKIIRRPGQGHKITYYLNWETQYQKDFDLIDFYFLFQSRPRQPDDAFIRKELFQNIRYWVKCLPPRERKVIKDTYWNDFTLPQIGKRMFKCRGSKSKGLSAGRISQILHEGLDILRIKYKDILYDYWEKREIC